MGAVGEKLREIRKARRMSLEELGKHLHMTQAAMSKMERGESKIDADMLPIIARILGVRPSAFFEEGIPKIEPAVEMAAQRAAELATERMKNELKAMLGEMFKRHLETSADKGKGQTKLSDEWQGYRPSIADIWAQGRVEQWRQLPESKQKRILEIMEESEESTEGQSQS